MEGESEGVFHSCDESMEQDDSVFEKEKVACDDNKMEDHIVHRSKKFVPILPGNWFSFYCLIYRA